jgi:3',5'-nucleoside bisphosphate phosphatase
MKNKPYIDLHLHSTESDGKLTPNEIVDKAIELNLHTIAITDHDSMQGVIGAEKYAQGLIHIIPGVELGCNEIEKGFPEVHILGYFPNSDNIPTELLATLQIERENQKKQMIVKLQELGFEINLEDICALGKNQLSRGHIAEVLLKKYPEQFSSTQEVFDQYIGVGKPAYVDHENSITIKDAVDNIKSCGGIAVLAHPGMYNNEDALKLVKYFIECGGQGIEVYYPYASIYVKKGVTKQDEQDKITFFKNLAEKFNLIKTGGSDFHGSVRNKIKINEMEILKENITDLIF